MGIMCDGRVSPKVKGKLFKTIVRPAMLFGMESVAVTSRQESQIEVAEMRMLRFSMGKTLQDHIRNEDIRNKMAVEAASGKLRETRLRWLGHVVRREESYVGRRVRNLPIGRRKRGRPKRRWEDCIQEDMRAVGVTEEQAADRLKWKKLIKHF